MPEFWTALLVGVVGAGFVWVRLRRGVCEPGYAVLGSGACALGLWVTDRLPAALVVGLVLLGLGEWFSREWPVRAQVVALVPGALVLGAALPDGWPFWSRAVVAAVAALAGLPARATDRALPRVTPLLFAIGAFGVYVCVPDTEAPKALLGALLALALVGVESRLRPVLGVPVLTGLFAWVVAYGGVGRPGSIVGGIACLGVVVLVPLARRRPHALVVIMVQAALVAFVARVAGLEESAWVALGLSAAAFAVAWLALRASRAR